MRNEELAQRDHEEGEGKHAGELRERMRAKIWVRSLCTGDEEGLQTQRSGETGGTCREKGKDQRRTGQSHTDNLCQQH